MAVKNSIHQQLLGTLRQRIAGLPVGSRFPTEHELCMEFGVARATINKVMVKLTEDGLITRTPRKGSFVMKAVRPQVPVTFLLPCADFISETIPDISAYFTRRMLKGVSQVAFEYDCRVETVPVSPTNNQHDIDWRKLDFVNADSRVVLAGDWYRDLFPLLLERGCRVALVTSHISHRQEDKDFINSCFRIILNASEAAEAAVEYLFKQGCRRIALFHHYILEPEHPIMGGYLSGLRKCGLTFVARHELSEGHLKLENVKNMLKDFYKKSGGFDSLLISPKMVIDLRLHNLYQELGLAEDIKIIVSNDAVNNQWVVPSLTSIAFPYEDIGRIAAQHLLSPEFSPGEQLISASLIERESTSTVLQKVKFASA